MCVNVQDKQTHGGLAYQRTRLCLYADGTDLWQPQPCSQTYCWKSYCTGLRLASTPMYPLCPPAHTHPLHPSILSFYAAGRRRSWSCSSRPVHSSMPPLRVSGAELQHRPPLSSPLRTLIHTPERGSYLQQHTHTLSKACVCVYLLTQTPSGSEKTHLLHSFAESVCASVSVCVLHLELCIHTPLFTVNKDRFHFINKLVFIWMINLKLVLVCSHSAVWFLFFCPAPCGLFCTVCTADSVGCCPWSFTQQQSDLSMVHFPGIIKKLALKRWVITTPAHIHCWVYLGWILTHIPLLSM